MPPRDFHQPIRVLPTGSSPRAMQAYVYRARVATTQSQDKVSRIAARGELAAVSGHSPLCRASVGTVKPSTKPPRAAPRSQVGMPGDQVAWDSEVPTYALYRNECSGSDYDAPLDAEQGGGRLEFTCLPPERDTMWTCVGCATGCGSFIRVVQNFLATI